MSLITRCPACRTMFKVVPDQLRISEGWVRCGQCAEIFDATAHLQDEAPVTAPNSLPVDPVPAQAIDSALHSEPFASSLNTEIGESVAFDAPDSALLEAEARAMAEHPLDRPFELRRQDPSPDASPRPTKPEYEPEPELQDVSFVREARRKEFWARSSVQALLLIVVIGLATLLALQVAVQDRDRLAAAEPALRPWLARLCEPLNCRIGAPHQIDAIAIDSSSFNKVREDAYRLNVTLKNQASMEVAMPALELTLTDVQDQVVARRVLVPRELGPAPGVIAAASEWSGSTSFTVATSGQGSRIAGYRLLAFYP